MIDDVEMLITLSKVTGLFRQTEHLKNDLDLCIYYKITQLNNFILSGHCSWRKHVF